MRNRSGIWDGTHIVPMGQVATVWQAKAHKTVLGLQKGCESREARKEVLVQSAQPYRRYCFALCGLWIREAT